MMQEKIVKHMLVIAGLVMLGVTEPARSAPRSAANASDGVGVDAAGNPFYATFSLCAVDRATGETGVAVTTRVPFVGRAVALGSSWRWRRRDPGLDHRRIWAPRTRLAGAGA